jgi:N utilization substance protein A
MIVNLGRAEAVLHFKEQIPRESYRIGDRIRAYIYDVDKNAKGPLIKLSRVRPEMLVKLFELEVPEIYDGIVEIKGAAREPGGRAKIAVYSRDIDVDPVGACVGMKGSRVQAIVYELRGEKIDIVPYSNDIATYVCNGLAPAEISKVIIDEREHAIEVIVPDNQLSLAIGKKGQNVRLASKLLGWKIEIHGETDAEQSFQDAKAKLEALHGVGDVIARSLINAGIYSVEDINEWDAESIATATQIGLKKAEKLKELARESLESAAEQGVAEEDEGEEVAPAEGADGVEPVRNDGGEKGVEESVEQGEAASSPTEPDPGEAEGEGEPPPTSQDRS